VEIFRSLLSEIRIELIESRIEVWVRYRDLAEARMQTILGALREDAGRRR
jgi:hypothetical protein